MDHTRCPAALRSMLSRGSLPVLATTHRSTRWIQTDRVISKVVIRRIPRSTRRAQGSPTSVRKCLRSRLSSLDQCRLPSSRGRLGQRQEGRASLREDGIVEGALSTPMGCCPRRYTRRPLSRLMGCSRFLAHRVNQQDDRWTKQLAPQHRLTHKQANHVRGHLRTPVRRDLDGLPRIATIVDRALRKIKDLNGDAASVFLTASRSRDSQRSRAIQVKPSSGSGWGSVSRTFFSFLVVLLLLRQAREDFLLRPINSYPCSDQTRISSMYPQLDIFLCIQQDLSFRPSAGRLEVATGKAPLYRASLKQLLTI